MQPPRFSSHPIRLNVSRLKQAASAALRAAVSRAVDSEARRAGFAVVRELYGHGVGRTIHEELSVPNYENWFSRDMLTEGVGHCR
jgi:methionyl aminopeptidase